MAHESLSAEQEFSGLTQLYPMYYYLPTILIIVDKWEL